MQNFRKILTEIFIIFFDIKRILTILKKTFVQTVIMLTLLTADACAMPFFSNTQRPFRTPVSVPIDITKAGNKSEILIKIKEEKRCVFELKFYYDDPRYQNKYKHVIHEGGGFFGSNFMFWVTQILAAPKFAIKERFEKKYTQEELREILKEADRVRKLIGTEELKNGKWIQHSGIPTPIKLTIVKIEKNNQEIMFNEVTNPGKIDTISLNLEGKTEYEIDKFKKTGNLVSVRTRTGDISLIHIKQNVIYKTVREPGSSHFSRYVERILLDPGIYKITIEILKDSPELIGTKTSLVIGGSRRKF